MKNYC